MPCEVHIVNAVDLQVRAQLEFAAQEDAAAAAASRSSNSYLAPEDLPGYNY